ncbi:MAG: hypothetical protein ACAH95_10915 [Fimbriimonas sp.]
MRLTSTQLKVFTTIMMLLCVMFLIAWPVFLGDRPGPQAPKAVNKEYAYRFVTYVSLMVLALILAAIGAMGVLRRTAAEYRAQQMENMKDLIEATMADHQKKSHDVD